MKRTIITLLSMLILLTTAYAQINIKSTTSTSERFYKGTWATVT